MPSRTPPDIREADPDDLGGIVELHIATLGGGLTALGPRAVRRYYARSLRDTGSRLLVAGSPAGTIAGLLELELEQRGMLERHGMIDRLVFAACAARRPRAAVRLLVRGRDGFGRASTDAAFLRFFAVPAGARGLGTGAAMLRTAAHLAEEVGLRAIETATSNDRLIAHYELRYNGRVVRSWGSGRERSCLIRLALPLPAQETSPQPS
jgi:GNAT superfamily N-acetyltransferase